MSTLIELVISWKIDHKYSLYVSHIFEIETAAHFHCYFQSFPVIGQSFLHCIFRFHPGIIHMDLIIRPRLDL